jgi:hypothetical protein
MKKRQYKTRTPPCGTFLGRRLLALDALLERLIFLALPSVLFQGLFRFRTTRSENQERKNASCARKHPVIRRVVI